MTGQLNLTLVWAVLVMVSFGAIPRRYWYVQLPAVLGWALVWVDSKFTDHWTDWLGLAMTGVSLMSLWATWTPGRAKRQERYDGEP